PPGCCRWWSRRARSPSSVPRGRWPASPRSRGSRCASGTAASPTRCSTRSPTRRASSRRSPVSALWSSPAAIPTPATWPCFPPPAFRSWSPPPPAAPSPPKPSAAAGPSSIRTKSFTGSAGEPGTPQGAETVRILPRSQPPALPVTLFGLAAFAGEGGGDGLGFFLAGGFDAGDLQRGRSEAEAAGGVHRGGGREAEDELAPLAEAALHLDAAAVRLDDSLGDGEPQPGALRLGRIEGDENAVLRFLRDAGARVGEPHLDLVGRVARRGVGGAQLQRLARTPRAPREPAAVGHRLHGVEHEIAEHLLELLRV